MRWLWDMLRRRVQPAPASAPPQPPSGTTVADCLDARSQTVLGAIPTMPARHRGHVAAVQVFFDLLADRRPAVFCDIGANKGEAGRRARGLLPQAQVLGFEANPGIHGRHRDLNVQAGIDWINAAVSDRAGAVDLHIPRVLARELAGDTLVPKAVHEGRDTGKSSLLKRDEDAEYEVVSVPAVRLDDCLAEKAPTGRVALWIDVEGAASLVVEGALRTLRRTDLIFIEVEGFRFWQDQTLAASVLIRLRQLGFVPVLRDREYGDAQFNVVLVRDSDRLPDILRQVGAAVEKARATPPSGALRTPQVTARTVPVLVPCFNNPTYCQGMLDQLLALGFGDITFVDNCSESPAMLAWLDQVSSRGARVERMHKNLGPRKSIFTRARLARLPRHFVVTDPDLGFHPALPPGFLQDLADAMARHRYGKAGFALDISHTGRLRKEPFNMNGRPFRIWEWERKFWTRRLDFTEGGDPVFQAHIDTTFALYDRKLFDPDQHFAALRVGGRLTATHLPWLETPTLPEEEEQLYRATQKFSYYLRPGPAPCNPSD